MLTQLDQRRRRNVAVQRFAIGASQVCTWLHSDSGMVRARNEVLRSIQRRWIGVVHFEQRTGFDKPSRRLGYFVQAVGREKRLLQRWILCKVV